MATNLKLDDRLVVIAGTAGGIALVLDPSTAVSQTSRSIPAQRPPVS